MLSDNAKKMRYDNGEDLDDPTGGMRGKHSYFLVMYFLVMFLPPPPATSMSALNNIILIRFNFQTWTPPKFSKPSSAVQVVWADTEEDSTSMEAAVSRRGDEEDTQASPSPSDKNGAAATAARNQLFLRRSSGRGFVFCSAEPTFC